MVDLKVGDIVQSLAGHDKSELFVILSVNKTISIANGTTKKLNKQKQKNKKHLKFIKFDDELAKALMANKADDAKVATTLKNLTNKGSNKICPEKI
ncbi:MAG: hypothetical protein RR140_01835 [Clostridia bacterium]